MCENIWQINHLDINGITNIEQVNNISEELFYLIIQKFRITTKKPNTIYQAIKLYVHIKSTLSRDIIISKQITRNNKKRFIYKLKENYNIDYT